MSPPHIHPTRRSALALAAGTVVLAATSPSWALGYPDKPISLVVASAPGGAGDSLARAIAEELHKRLRQPVIVENLSGASGAIGVQKVLRAPADGYTLLFGTTGDMILTPIASRTAGYSLKDFTPVARLSVTPMALVARPGLGVATFDQLVTLARQRSSPLTIAVSGNVSLSAFGAVAITRAAQIELLSVPYKSAPPMMNDLLGGQVDLSVGALPSVLAHVRAGKLTMLGLLSQDRASAAPDWPTLNESAAAKGIAVEVWASIAGPPSLPPAIVDKLNRALQEALADPVFRDARTKLGDTLAPPARAEEFARFLVAEDARYRRLAVGMKLE